MQKRGTLQTQIASSVGVGGPGAFTVRRPRAWPACGKNCQTQGRADSRRGLRVGTRRALPAPGPESRDWMGPARRRGRRSTSACDLPLAVNLKLRRSLRGASGPRRPGWRPRSRCSPLRLRPPCCARLRCCLLLSLPARPPPARTSSSSSSPMLRLQVAAAPGPRESACCSRYAAHGEAPPLRA
jgi:hypothetical protein